MRAFTIKSNNDANDRPTEKPNFATKIYRAKAYQVAQQLPNFSQSAPAPPHIIPDGWYVTRKYFLCCIRANHGS